MNILLGLNSSSQAVFELMTKIQEPYSKNLIRYSEIQQSELMNGIEKMNLVREISYPSVFNHLSLSVLETPKSNAF